MRRRRRVGATAGLLVLLVGALGCAPDPGDPGRQAATRPLPSGVARALSTDATGSLTEVVTRSSREESFAFKVTAQAGQHRIIGTGRARVGGAPALEVELLNPDGSKLPARVVDDVVYVQVPAAYRAAVKKNWVSLNLLRPPTASGGSGLTEFTQFLQDFDPVVQAKALLKSGKVTVVGEETIGSVRAIRYTGKVPVSVLAAQVRPELRNVILAKARAAGATVTTLDLWIDDTYTPRRTRWQAGTVSGTAEYTGWGTPVTVARPPAAETVDIATVLPAFTNR